MSEEIRQRSGSKGKCLVVGGAGFLGSHLAEDLISRGYTVSVYDIRSADPIEGVTYFQGDICDLTYLSKAMEGCDIVFSCVTPSPLIGYANRDLFFHVNVQGTNTLVNACKQKGVPKLVQTSSATVVYNGVDLENGNEMLPYAAKPLDNYILTKGLQEQIVLRANCPELLTCVIRPNAIFGPRDPYILPSIIDAGRTKNKFIIGSGYNKIDLTYVRDVTQGLILAAESLKPGSVSCGSAYNMTNEYPVEFWNFNSRILTRLNYPVPTIHLPYKLIYFCAWFLVLLCWIISPIKKIMPILTPIKVTLAGTHAYFSSEKAKKELGYKAKYSMEEAIDLSIKHFDYAKKK
ncbi:Sterol-4-alpha-carboxylate 3-dehydrogenase, decarboxylating [Oopsacas minuta]|uniref:Sterol-4-alpha-carboxylate 3-dehydrogenase, decarboxylating n=1 Tax=Oopsacas minuta TaxID=111878 RepID=A0AAV7JKN7_9METZ|nr:Sterol-4-alpha-carboxylate 3-dehydrogenase, decarboxylating [Oopsacas minuta]